MKKYSQLLESLSVLLIFILLLQLSGCYSTRVISASDLVIPDSENYSYVIRTRDAKYRLENPSITADTLYARITKTESVVRGNKVRMYLSADSLLKFHEGGLVKIPLNKITRAVDAEFSLGQTIFLGVISIPVAIFIAMLIDLAINGFDISLNLGG